ncbi:MAG TPA: alpha-glucan family phosphorylase [Nitrosomonas sp.]|nr:alpha-glucan family phosphorylase [Nitrosomonas sp.]HQX12913.1 alpha-glucan family phosphorylase [Nitrosomonas sp.]HRB32616.1 alpha-glucan family phosphorylase [Nitrosomonas sp.]HRB45884.1 alpha-glucan family phosphorylase [Nitrosomonas sp.]HRB77768.1 alpha-glucan family phosphorylase [Nitrosomonas sp.]
MLHESNGIPRVAYFSMEIALDHDISTYSGGLGVLAGDTLRSAADVGLHMVAVTLVSRAGYFYQQIGVDGNQIEIPQFWNPEQRGLRACPAKVSINIEGRTVWIGGWEYKIRGQGGGTELPVILLDTDLPENAPEDRELSLYLYGGDATYRFKQEMILGIGGTRLLQALGFHINKYHMNEGHSALLTIELLQRYAYSYRDLRPGESAFNLPLVRSKCIFTTHTPVEAGQDKFDYNMVQRVVREDFIDIAELKKLAGEDCLNMTRLALNLSEYINGVAKGHAVVSRQMFPSYRVHAITNGVYSQKWASPQMAVLYDQFLPGWRHEPEQLQRIDQIDEEKILQAHHQAKTILFDLVQKLSGKTLDLSLPTIGFARRMTAYKRPDLLFSDRKRLRAIAKKQPFQLILAGKAHPSDYRGKELISALHRFIQELADDLTIVYLPGYDTQMALSLVSGVDIWLNTPLRPMEASGTSGMKAAFNGVPSLSVLDGWWLEGCQEGVTGWAVGGVEVGNEAEDIADLYHKLEHVVLPAYADRKQWIQLMRGAIGHNASVFNTHRMIRRYASEAYKL